jgi:formylglycine-generating enzyme required for sulfatase activity
MALLGKSSFYSRCILFVFGIFGATFWASAITAVDVIKVKQRWPWNNKVDVTYKVTADNPDKRVSKILITTDIDGVTHTVYDGAINENAAPGLHTITWENAPDGIKSDNLVMKASIYSALVPKGDDYMIIKLADGSIEYEGLFPDVVSIGGVGGQELSNIRYNTDKYKTTHYPLRKISKGTYKTGDSVNFGSGSAKNTDATWTTDKVFYIGLFKWTNFQYWHVLDFTTHDRDISQVDTIARPLNFMISIRGSLDPSVKPAPVKTTNYRILEWLNAKTQAQGYDLVFDLPTEVMREIAIRAGTDTPYFWGTDPSLASEYVVFGQSFVNYYNGGKNYYGANKTPGTKGQGFYYVGRRKPNNWGLFDMVGLDWEWCLDSYKEGQDPATCIDAFTPFYMPSATINRVGGADANGIDASVYRSSIRSTAKNNDGKDNFAVRISCIIPNEDEYIADEK